MMYVNIISLSTLWLTLSAWGPADSPSPLSLDPDLQLWKDKNISHNKDSSPLTSSKLLQPTHLIKERDGPLVWIRGDPKDEVCDEEPFGSPPPDTNAHVFVTKWFNTSGDGLWNLNTREQLLITSTDISTPKTQRREFPPSALLPEAGLLIDIWVFILSLLTQDHLWRSWSLEHALRKFLRKLKCPEERPTLCVAGRKRRRRRKKGRKRNEESTACNKESAGEINRAECKKNDTAQLAEETKKKNTNNRRKVGRETSPETLTTTTTTESNLFQKKGPREETKEREEIC